MDKKRSVFFIWDGIAHVSVLANGRLGTQAVMRLRDVMQQLYRAYQRIDIDLLADSRQAAWGSRHHCLPDTRSHYLILSEFDVPRVLEAIAPYGLGMYCQDLADTKNAKLKDFTCGSQTEGAAPQMTTSSLLCYKPWSSTRTPTL